MRIYIKEWPNRAATLYTEAGEELCTFPGLDAALVFCQDARVALADLLERGDIETLRAVAGARHAA